MDIHSTALVPLLPNHPCSFGDVSLSVGFEDTSKQVIIVSSVTLRGASPVLDEFLTRILKTAEFDKDGRITVPPIREST